jgi:hypothetical protein
MLISLFFLNIMRPFLWCFPSIFFLEAQNFTFLDSPVPIIIGSDMTTQQLKFHYGLVDQRDHSLIFYYIEENILEGKIDDIIIPTFNGKVEKIEKRFKRLRQFFTSTNFQLKNKEAYINNFLVKFREMLDSAIVDPIMRFQFYASDIAFIIDKLVERNKNDFQFFSHFGKTQTFTKYIENLKKSMKESGDRLPEYDDLV